MHGSCLGVVKRLILIWLGKLKTNNNFKPISKSNQSVKPYSRITYRPRSLNHQADFRAIEYKYMMFFYLRYALRNILENRYIKHFELFSAAVYILCKSKINEDDIKKADQMLNEFCDSFEILYGTSVVTLNVHLLRHYALIARNAGPLWAYSLFGFESNMGVLARYSSNPANVVEQITEKYIISHSFNGENQPDNKPKFSISKNVTTEYDHILKQHGLDEIDGKTTKIAKGKTLYKSILCKDTGSVDYFLEMKDGVIGSVIFYAIKDSKIFVLLNVYEVVKGNFHLKEIFATKNYILFPFEAIKDKLIHLQFGTINIVTVEPNKFEKT